MPAGVYNFVLEQGADFSRRITYKISDVLVDLTGYTARMKIKHRTGAPALETLTTENGKIALGGSDGTILLTLTATDTEDLEAAAAVYDLELVSPGGVVTRLLKGDVLIDAEVTN